MKDQNVYEFENDVRALLTEMEADLEGVFHCKAGYHTNIQYQCTIIHYEQTLAQYREHTCDFSPNGLEHLDWIGDALEFAKQRLPLLKLARTIHDRPELVEPMLDFAEKYTDNEDK